MDTSFQHTKPQRTNEAVQLSFPRSSQQRTQLWRQSQIFPESDCYNLLIPPVTPGASLKPMVEQTPMDSVLSESVLSFSSSIRQPGEIGAVVIASQAVACRRWFGAARTETRCASSAVRAGNSPGAGALPVSRPFIPKPRLPSLLPRPRVLLPQLSLNAGRSVCPRENPSLFILTGA